MKKIFVKESACIGCRLCEVFCRAAHSPSKDLVKAFNKDSPTLPRARVEVSEPTSFSVQCRHCDEPSCVYACLTGALHRDAESGIVMVDTERCIGCWTCILACPCAAIRQDTLSDKITKCDLCRGEPEPACVAHCPNEALVYVEAGDSA